MEGDGIHRMEIPEIPVDAMREAVINSFAHARYDLPHCESRIVCERV